MTVTYDRSVVSLGTPVPSTNKTDRHYITETLLKVASKTITLSEKYFVTATMHTYPPRVGLSSRNFHQYLTRLHKVALKKKKEKALDALILDCIPVSPFNIAVI